jgi:hypothetical protein
MIEHKLLILRFLRRYISYICNTALALLIDVQELWKPDSQIDVRFNRFTNRCNAFLTILVPCFDILTLRDVLSGSAPSKRTLNHSDIDMINRIGLSTP